MRYSLFFAASLVCLTSLAGAQSQQIKPFAQVKVTKAVVTNTYDVFPQIQPSRGPSRVQDTNEREVPRVPNGTVNSLKAGRTTSEARVELGAKPKWPGIAATGWVPPDPTAAVGPNHVVVTVNSDIAFFSKTGTKLFQQGMGPDGFFSGVSTTDFVFDPKTFYDPGAKRFFVICPELDDAGKTSGMLVAVSATSDPRGAWNKFRIDTKITDNSADFWLDYPGFGFNKDRIVFCGNMFGFESGTAGTLIVSLNKANLIAGNTADGQQYRVPNFSLQWAKGYDANLDVLYGAAVASTSSIKLFALNGTGSGTATLTSTDVTVPTFKYPNGGRSTNGRTLDALDARLLAVGSRNGRIVASHGIVPLNASNVSARWYEFLTQGWPKSGSPKLNQAGDILGTSDTDHFMPAININKNNAIGVVYTRSSANITADVMVAGRRSTDPLGTMGKPTLLASSKGTYGGQGYNRWGDYFSVEIDPSDSLTFWGIGMVSDGGPWLTQVVNWKVSADVTSGNLYKATSVKPYQALGKIEAGGLSSLWAADGALLQQASASAGALGQAAALEITYTNGLKLSTDTFALRLKSKGPLKGTLNIWVYNQKTKVYDFLEAKPTSGAFLTTTFSVDGAKVANYIATTGAMKFVVRVAVPARQGGTAGFAHIVDEASLLATSK